MALKTPAIQRAKFSSGVHSHIAILKFGLTPINFLGPLALTSHGRPRYSA